VNKLSARLGVIATPLAATTLLVSCLATTRDATGIHAPQTPLPAAASAPAPSFPAYGKTINDVWMYAGPDVKYPPVTHLAADLHVTIYGCLGSWQWCDVDWRGDRGWIKVDSLNYRDDEKEMPAAAARKLISVARFDRKSYWNAHYRDRLWFSSRP
jgi:uncharacterized protein YraI